MRALYVGLAFLVFSIGACGDDGVGNLTDAPPPPDMAMPDAPTTGPVKITITTGTLGIPNIRVLFQNPDSSLVLSTTTDANGVATATMGVGGFVTAVDPFPRAIPQGIAGPGDLRTFAGVKPGDELILHEDNGNVDLVNITIAVPVDGAISRYFLRTPCTFGAIDITNAGGSGSGSGAPGGPVTLFGCGGTTDIMIEGQDASGIPVRTLYKPNVALSEGGVVDLSADTYVTAVDSTFMYTNVPARFGSLNVASVVATTRGNVFDIFQSIDVVSGSAALSAKAPPVIPGTLAITITELFDNLSFHSVVGWAASTNAYLLDAGAVLLPEFTDFPRFEIDTRTGTWGQAATGATPDFAVVTWQFDRPSAKSTWFWSIAAPFTGASVVMPVLPPDAAMFNPVAGDNANINELSTVKVPGGYDAVREVALTPSQNSIIVGPTGQAVVQDLQFGKAKRTVNKTKRWGRTQKSSAVRR